jgi:hypothetical protein
MRTVARTVMRNGIAYGNSIYFHVDLNPYAGTKVLVRKDKDGLQVFNAYGKPICLAKEVTFSSAEREGGKHSASAYGSLSA